MLTVSVVQLTCFHKKKKRTIGKVFPVDRCRRSAWPVYQQYIAFISSLCIIIIVSKMCMITKLCTTTAAAEALTTTLPSDTTKTTRSSMVTNCLPKTPCLRDHISF